MAPGRFHLSRFFRRTFSNTAGINNDDSGKHNDPRRSSSAQPAPRTRKPLLRKSLSSTKLRDRFIAAEVPPESLLEALPERRESTLVRELDEDASPGYSIITAGSAAVSGTTDSDTLLASGLLGVEPDQKAPSVRTAELRLDLSKDDGLPAVTLEEPTPVDALSNPVHGGVGGADEQVYTSATVHEARCGRAGRPRRRWSSLRLT
jgi:hypothetical protein